MERLIRSPLHHHLWPDPPVRCECECATTGSDPPRKSSSGARGLHSAGHIIPTTARKARDTRRVFTHALPRTQTPFLSFLLLLFKMPSRVDPSRAEPSAASIAAGCPQPLTAVRVDEAEMWLPVRLAASHLRTQRPHYAPWIEPG